MARWRFWERENSLETVPPVVPPATPEIAPRARGFQPPPPRDQPTLNTLIAEVSDKLARLQRRRDAVMFDVEQAESAAQPDNPWTERMVLLDEALAAVARDREALASLPAQPGEPVSPVPITDIQVVAETPSAVSFTIGSERFDYSEDIDWAERGTQLVKPELVHRSGDPTALVPSALSGDRQEALVDHLTASLFVFATDLRNRALNGTPLPETPTLADLARPCDDCGGWRDWHGTCAECQRRAWQRQHFDAEEERLLGERKQEEEERARLADRLPIARRRLAEVDAEIAALGG